MREASRALIYAIETGEIFLPDGPVLVLHGEAEAFSRVFPQADVMTPYAGEAGFWGKVGHGRVTELAPDHYAAVLVVAPKQKDELAFVMASAIASLRAEGQLVVSSENLMGGRSLEALFHDLGASQTSCVSKHKSRVVWARIASGARDFPAVISAQDFGRIRKRPDGLWSCPGLFSWDRLDVGTFALVKALPDDLAGLGADLGAGIGEIGLRLLQNAPHIRRLTLVEHDERAVECARKNLADFGDRAGFVWADITQTIPLAAGSLDFVVMNPPFHKGREESTALGQCFVKQAASLLKKSGKLVMVANVHLPYERTLSADFQQIEIISQENGFKVISAVKA